MREVSIWILGGGPTDGIGLVLLVMMCVYFLCRIPYSEDFAVYSADFISSS